jgi:hypothetical protein
LLFLAIGPFLCEGRTDIISGLAFGGQVTSYLGIVPGGTYQMDIFHAERHREMSNFRVETNISCFETVDIVVK